MHNHKNKVFMLNNKRGLRLKLIWMVKKKELIAKRE